MTHLRALLRQQYVGLVALVLTVSGLAAAATGQPAILGRSNSSDKPTVLASTGNGPVLTLRAKAGQPALKVNSNKLVGKLNADLLDGKHASAFATAGSGYTKTESDAKYLDATEAYSRTEADSAFAPLGGAYTKAEADAKFGQVVFSGTYSGTTPATQFDETNALAGLFAVPGAGVLSVMLWIDAPANPDCEANAYSDSAVRATAKNDTSAGALGYGGMTIAAAGNASLSIKVRNIQNSSAIDCSGTVAVVYYPV